MINIDWNNIRPIDGSQRTGFEELCAQLARIESPPGAHFVRKGTPDGGVECFCILTDGTEWGWQAKYFPASLGNAQWAQLDDSVETALDRHPALTRYFLCIPRNRSDGRRQGQTTELDRWNAHVQKWQGWAEQRGMEVEFVWWGDSELLYILSRPDQIGRCWFWFNLDVFDDHWFRQRLDEAIATAGPRYTPEIHVDLAIARQLEAFTWTEGAFAHIKSLARDIRKNLSGLGISRANDGTRQNLPEVTGLQETVNAVLNGFSKLHYNPIADSQLEALVEGIKTTDVEVDKIRPILDELARDHDGTKTSEGSRPSHHHNPFREASRQVNRIQRSLDNTRFELEKASRLADSRVIVISGHAGVGKTHLLCDFSLRYHNAGGPVVILMGQRFSTSEDPWAQMLQMLGLDADSPEAFVGALEAAAQAANSRAIVIIDALNEATYRDIWSSHLPSYLTRLHQSPWISVMLAIRSSYEEVTIPAEVRTQGLSIEHEGFGDQQYDAIRTFFSYYGLEFPSAPTLHPEFNNPLFLKTVCMALQRNSERRLPRGFHGITSVFEYYLDAINYKLAKVLDYDPRDRLVHKAVDLVARQLVEGKRYWLARAEAAEWINELLPGKGFNASLYRGLVAEGVVLENWNYAIGGEVALLAYEKFADHVIANMLLDAHLDTANPRSCFEKGGELEFLQQGPPYPTHGLLEALSVQIPERTGQELVDLAPTLLDHYSTGHAFSESIVCRRLDAFSENTMAVLRELENRDMIWDPLDMILTVSTVPGHRFNAEYLDRRLRSMPMADRDAAWSIYIHNAYGTKGPIDRLIDWAWRIAPEDNLELSVIDLATTTLGWMLTTSNRFLRDRATKAVVSLLTGRLDSVTALVAKFSDVDDPYVTERVYAVAYGVAMRSYDNGKVGVLAQLVYERIFASDSPPAHILLRDYARGVVERAIHLGADIDVDEARIRPPFSSIWPHIPDEAVVEELGAEPKEPGPGAKNSKWDQTRIYDSVMHDDFGHYVIGESPSNWLSLKLDEDVWQPPDVRYSSLLSELSDREASVVEEFDQVKANRPLPYIVTQFVDKDRNVVRTTQDECGTQLLEDYEALQSEYEKTLALSKQRLARELTPEHWATLETILEELDDPDRRRGPRLDMRIVKRYVVWRAFDLGWTVDRFGRFDRDLPYDGRTATKAERIGKKYQWIAYHEILAYLSDHNQYCGLYDEEDVVRGYQGPWQESLRDIDPSCTLSRTQGGTSWGGHAKSWWGAESYDAWGQDLSYEEWVALEGDLPNINELLRVTDPNDGTSWLNVQGYFNWKEVPPPDVEPYDVERREVWLIATGYFIKAEEANDFMTWAQTVDFMGRWMPEGPKEFRLYLGEYGWSPAFKHLHETSYSNETWTQAERGCPIRVQPCSSGYVAEGAESDCSIDDYHELDLPHHEFVAHLGLKWSGSGAEYLDDQKRIVAFDPTVKQDGPTALLISEQSMKRYLQDKGLALCWTVIGEKYVLGTMSGRHHHGLLTVSGAYRHTDCGPEGFVKFQLRLPSTAS